MKKSFLFDIFIIILCSSLIATGLYLFFTDINKTIDTANTEVIGTIRFKKQSAQRKFANRVVWQEVEKTAPVYSFDSIRTQKGSEAIITLEDGTEVTLGENTLLMLDWSKDKRSIEFLEGTVSANRSDAKEDTTITIKSKDNIVEVKKAEVSVEKSQTGKIGVEVQKGDVSLVSQGKVSKINTNEKATIENASSAPVIEKIPLLITSPKNNSYFLTHKDSENLSLDWTSTVGFSSYKLSYSANVDFTNSVSITETSANKATVTIPKGEWYLKLQAKSATQEAEKIIKISILKENALETISPSKEAVYSFKAEYPLIRYFWQSSDIADSYTLEIANNSNFTNPVYSEKVKSSETSHNKLGEGTWYWRVKPNYPFTSSLESLNFLSSNVNTFKINKIVSVDPPLLIEPEDNSKIQEIAALTQGIIFSWKGLSETGESTLLLSRNSDFTDIALKIDTKQASYNWKNQIKSGTYFWKVQSSLQDGTSVPESQVRKLEISRFEPKLVLQSPENNSSFYPKTDNAINFTWESDTRGNFLLEVSKSQDFKTEPIQKETSAFESTMNDLESGTYFWRIKYLSFDGSVLNTSSASSFTIKETLNAPKILYPLENDNLTLINTKEIQFSWSKINDALSYDFALYDGLNRLIKEAKNVSTNAYTFTLPENLKKGAYTWIVSALGGTKENPIPGKSKKAQFYIEELAQIAKPKALSPKQNALLNELTISKENGLQLSWALDSQIESYDIQLAKDEAFINKVLDVESSESNTNAGLLLEGSYFWKLIGKTKNGVKIESDIFTFKVAKTPNLDTVVIESPKNNSRIDMQKEESLSFKWNKVKGANAYLFRLKERKSGKVIFEMNDYTQTTYVFKNLEKLDTTDFTFTIQALSKNKDGRIEQKSLLSETTFSLYLSGTIKAPELFTPEFFYVED